MIKSNYGDIQELKLIQKRDISYQIRDIISQDKSSSESLYVHDH